MTIRQDRPSTETCRSAQCQRTRQSATSAPPVMPDAPVAGLGPVGGLGEKVPRRGFASGARKDRRIRAFASRTAKFPQVVQREEQRSHIPVVHGVQVVDFGGRYRRAAFSDQLLDQLPGCIERAADFHECGKAHAPVCRDQQAGMCLPAAMLQRAASQPGHLLVTVDDQLRGCPPGSPTRECGGRNSPLPNVERVPVHGPPFAFQQRYQGVQKRRLAAAVRADDLPPPSLTRKSLDQPRGTRACRELISQRSRAHVPCREGIRVFVRHGHPTGPPPPHEFAGGGVLSSAKRGRHRACGFQSSSSSTSSGLTTTLAFGSSCSARGHFGMSPRTNACSKKASLPRRRNTRRRTHQRIFRATPK